jgi:ATP-dependent DNA ligase
MKDRSGKEEHIGAHFIEPTLCLAVEKLPEGPARQYEIKVDGYQAIGVRMKSGVELWSRNRRDFSRRFANVAARTLSKVNLMDTSNRLVEAGRRR